jgi:hypothetical protein
MNPTTPADSTGPELTIEPVYGVRWWKLGSRLSLRGMRGILWTPGSNEAECGRARMDIESHEPPHPDCDCGVYAFWRPEPTPVGGSIVVCGVMLGLGRTIIGTRGFRSQRGKIIALARPDGPFPFGDSLEHVLAASFDAPVYPDIGQMLAAHPPTSHYLQPEDTDQ